MFKVNDKNTRRMSTTSFWCFYPQLWILFSKTPATVSTKGEVFLNDFFSKFEDISKYQLLTYSHFLKKFLRETLHFSECWLFLKKWNNESVINVTPLHLILTPPIDVYPPKNVRKTFVPTKFWRIFKLNPPIIMGGQKPC